MRPTADERHVLNTRRALPRRRSAISSMVRMHLALPVGVSLLAALATSSEAAVAAQPSAVELSGTVTSTRGDPIPEATVHVDDQQFTADGNGKWRGQLPFSPVYHQWAAAQGYRASSPDFFYPDPSVAGLEVSPLSLDNKLQSVFDVDPTQYANVANTDPPTITQFTTDEGQQKSQVLAADTKVVVVQGTVGSRDGDPRRYVSCPSGRLSRTPLDGRAWRRVLGDIPH